MSALAPPPASLAMVTQGFARRGPVEHDGTDRSLYVEDVEGNVVEVGDFFERGDGRRDGAAALAGGDAPPDDPSS